MQSVDKRRIERFYLLGNRSSTKVNDKASVGEIQRSIQERNYLRHIILKSYVIEKNKLGYVVIVSSQMKSVIKRIALIFSFMLQSQGIILPNQVYVCMCV